jgi:O-glycosyl hydrolase
MKEGLKKEGGWLREEHYGAYARYLLQFIEQYQAEGVPLHAITVQNEPLSLNKRYPTTLMLPAAQMKLISQHVGPLLRSHNCSVRIWAFDHNFDGGNMEYPQQLLRSAARQFIDGIAYHNYAGHASSMSRLHAEFPDSGIYFTEGSVYGVSGAQAIVQYFRNWAQSYNAWVTILDENGQPNSGPFVPDPTMVQLNSTDGSVVYRYEYFMYGQFSKFIRPGAVRVSSEFAAAVGDGIDHVAFIHDDGRHALVLVNYGLTEQAVDVQWRGWGARVTVCSACVITVVW